MFILYKEYYDVASIQMKFDITSSLQSGLQVISLVWESKFVLISQIETMFGLTFAFFELRGQFQVETL